MISSTYLKRDITLTSIIRLFSYACAVAILPNFSLAQENLLSTSNENRDCTHLFLRMAYEKRYVSYETNGKNSFRVDEEIIHEEYKDELENYFKNPSMPVIMSLLVILGDNYWNSIPQEFKEAVQNTGGSDIKISALSKKLVENKTWVCPIKVVASIGSQ